MHKTNTRRGYTQNVVICPPCGESVAGATKEGQNWKKTLWPLLPRLTAVLPPQGREMHRGFILGHHLDLLSGRTINYRLGASPTGTARLPGSVARTAGELSGSHPTYKEALNKNAFRAQLRSGFTLIELLVVVLIIGILAAVALPQYQKAVAKTRAVELVSILRTGEKAMDAWILAHGYTDVSQSGMDIVIRPSETIKKFWLERNFYCAGENPEYPDEDIGCWISFDDNGGGADISWANENYTWSRTCTPYTTNGQTVCNYLKQSFPDMTID